MRFAVSPVEALKGFIMQIFGISLVKNEEDIIESFVRYNLLIMDRMIIIDNGSTDGTLSILEAMVNEGLPISLTSDVGDYNQIRIMNRALSEVIHGSYGIIPDYIIPIDADEFLVGEDRITNPREIIQNLDSDTLHKVLWRTYIPSEIMPPIFSPEGMCNVRDKKYESGEKLIIPVKLIREGFVLNNGNHDAFAPYVVTKLRCESLRVAHFPIRNPVQFFLKNVLGYYNRLSTKTYVKGRSRHIENAYYTIKREGKVSLKTMQKCCLNYCSDDVPDGATQEEPFSKWYPEDIQPQYGALAKHNALFVMLNDIETIVSNYRGTFGASEKACFEDKPSFDLDIYKAIEQYSFKKMRVERIKRDYYQGLASLYQHYYEAKRIGVQIESVFEAHDKHSTVMLGENMISSQLGVELGIPVICSPVEKMLLGAAEVIDFSEITQFVVNNKTKTVVAFDATRIEELMSSIDSSTCVIDYNDYLISLLEMRK